MTHYTSDKLLQTDEVYIDKIEWWNSLKVKRNPYFVSLLWRGRPLKVEKKGPQRVCSGYFGRNKYVINNKYVISVEPF